MTRPPGRISSLTGLRGVAIALVLAAHAHVPHLGVGLFGVDVFFVLSGFLITHVLLELAQERVAPTRFLPAMLRSVSLGATPAGLGRVVMVVPTYNEADNIAWIIARLRDAVTEIEPTFRDDVLADVAMLHPQLAPGASAGVTHR